MEPKDYISISISAIAVLIALTSFVLSSYRKANDDRRALRASLNDVIAKIFSVGIEHAKYVQQNPNWAKTDLTLSVTRLLTAQLNSYARLADYIIPKIKGLVSDVELATVADAFAGTGDYAEASAYWKIAIAASKNKSQEVQYRRKFSMFLFGIGQVGDAREEFQRAINLFRDNDDISKAQNGATYKFWGLAELRVDNKKMAENYLLYARDLYTSITNDTLKLPLLFDLNQAIVQLQQTRSDPLQAVGLGSISDILASSPQSNKLEDDPTTGVQHA
jgi:tetratricopeptide (TPR) repeat protein